MNENLDTIKASLDIVTIAELYGELEKSGANYRYKDDHSIVINPSKQIFSNFNGDITGGSVLDLIAYMEKLELREAIKRLKELAGADTYKIDPALQLKRNEEATKKKVVDFRSLGLFAKNDLNAGQSKKPIPVMFDDSPQNNHLMVNGAYHKLYERKEFPLEYQKKFDYLHQKIIGYDEFFKCASIIIRDRHGKVVDKIAYRPIKPDNFDKWSDPKYIYKNSHNRGINFLYPFQEEVEKIINREKYIIVGEGIKNAVNALIYSAPYITIESTSNSIPKELINYLKEYQDRGFGIVCMFDGDKAGLQAYNRFKEQTGINADNHLDFSSGVDFTEYIIGSES
jgi:DNA primase